MAFPALTLAFLAILLGTTATPAHAAFAAGTNNGASTFAAARTFSCPYAGLAILIPTSGDVTVYQGRPQVNDGANTRLRVSGVTGEVTRTLLSFSLPEQQPSCTVKATLELTTTHLAAGREHRVAPLGAGWGESTVTWETAPRAREISATTTTENGTVSWDVTQLVHNMWEFGNHGLVLSDAAVTDRATDHGYSSREGGDAPTLTVSFG